MRIASAALRGVTRLPTRVKRVVAGSAIRLDGAELDLDTQLLLRLSRLLPERDPDVADVETIRRNASRTARLVGWPQAVVNVAELTVRGAAGPLAARSYDPGGADAVLVYFHGGGWVHGDLDSHDALCRWLARESGLRVVAVEYRRAPEHPYPAPPDDAEAAFHDIVSRAAEFNIEPDRVGVGGDSAGGNLAAVLCQRAVRSGMPAPMVQLLIYPGTDFAVKHPSRHMFAEGFFLTQTGIDFFERCYLPPHPDRRDPDLSPLHAANVAGLPPTIVITAGFDPLRDEGEAYADILGAAGVPVVTRRFPGYTHGFANNLVACAAAVTDIARLLRQAATRPTPR